VWPQQLVEEAPDEGARVKRLSLGPMLTERGRHRAKPTPPVTMARGSSFLHHILVGLDAAALSASWVVTTEMIPTKAQSRVALLVAAMAFVGGGLVIFSAMGLYRARVCSLRPVEYSHLARACVLVALLAFAVTAISHTADRREIALGTPLAFLLTIVLRSGYRSWLTNQRRLGRYLRPVLLFGAGSESADVVALLAQHPELGYRTAGVVGDEREALRHGLKGCWCGELDDGLAVLAEAGGTGAIVCAGDLHPSQLNQIVQQLLQVGVHVHLSSGLHGIDIGRLRPSPLAHEPFFYVERMTLASWQLVTKRAIDLVLSSTLLILMLPVLGLAALGIKFQDLGPVLFKQSRIGRHGASFVLYKVRTMREGAESETDDLLELNMRDGPLTKFSGDPRVTMLGRILRATSIDELPQLWNVLNGSMSLVGPRPALPNEVLHFDADLRARESVRPGITGLWQVEGRDNPSFAAYRRFDLFYIQNWSVALDLMILLLTVESVIARILRALIHLDGDIQIAPPFAQDPVEHRSLRDDEARTIESAASVGASRGQAESFDDRA
jgi:exopolysaccharide biosynthesis polyprenyl glycosylphosphotransferase